ncbi:MAG TPA: DUF3313 domain-containing protein [Burkholderiales bacterium]|nr:DUF3313 domain-containing protein [Burkholderiales bacterium]
MKATGAMVTMVVLVSVLASGTAGAQDKPAPAQQNSGFLSDYSKLTPAPDNPNSRRWIDKDFDFKPYSKIMFDPVEIWVSPTSEYKGVSPATLKRMGDDFTRAFKSALHPGYELVNQPGPGVLRIRLAMTGVNLGKPPMKPYQVLPVFAIARAASSDVAATLSGEMQVLDPNDKVVAAAVFSGTGDQTFAEKQEITWKQLEGITATWAKNLRRGLDTARGIAPAK